MGSRAHGIACSWDRVLMGSRAHGIACSWAGGVRCVLSSSRTDSDRCVQGVGRGIPCGTPLTPCVSRTTERDTGHTERDTGHGRAGSVETICGIPTRARKGRGVIPGGWGMAWAFAGDPPDRSHSDDLGGSNPTCGVRWQCASQGSVQARAVCKPGQCASQGSVQARAVYKPGQCTRQIS
jgi:hypothetical protein